MGCVGCVCCLSSALPAMPSYLSVSIQGHEHPSTANLMRVLCDVRTALEIHAFDSGEGDGDLNNDHDGESIEARFPNPLLSPPFGSTNSPIPTPPFSQRTAIAES